MSLVDGHTFQEVSEEPGFESTDSRHVIDYDIFRHVTTWKFWR